MYGLDVQVGGDLGHVLAGEVAAAIDIEDVREPVHRPPPIVFELDRMTKSEGERCSSRSGSREPRRGGLQLGPGSPPRDARGPRGGTGTASVARMPLLATVFDGGYETPTGIADLMSAGSVRCPGALDSCRAFSLCDKEPARAPVLTADPVERRPLPEGCRGVLRAYTNVCSERSAKWLRRPPSPSRS